MPAFRYRALDPRGRTVRGVADADSERQARRLLRERGLTPVELRLNRQAAGNARALLSAGGPLFGPRLSQERLALLTQTLATLLQAGLPIDDALSALINQAENDRVRALLVDVRARLVAGHSLESALNGFPEVFDEVYRATVGAGEQTRHLPLVLARLGDHVQRSAELRQRIRVAMVYPAVLIVVSVLVVGGLLVYVVPDVVAVFTQSASELPLSTRLLIRCSEILQRHGLWLLLGICAAVLLARWALRRPAVRERVHRLALRLPVSAGFVRQRDYSRFAQTLGVLLGNGVEMLDALKIAGKSAGNLLIRAELAEVGQRVREGEALHQALLRGANSPRLLAQLCASGESAGEEPRKLEAASAAMERTLSARLAMLLSLLEPALILLMGGIVLFIVLAILLPIFEMNTLL